MSFESRWTSLFSFTLPEILTKSCDFPWEVLKNIPHFFDQFSFLSSTPPPGVFFGSGTIIIEKGVTIDPGVYIEGPAYLGAFSHVGHGAYLRGGVILFEKAVVGHACEIKNSLLLPEAKAAHFNYVGDSILGTGANLGAGVKCANLRFDQQNIQVRFEGKKINSGFRKLGALVGDHSQIGCNAVLAPGTLIGKSFMGYPLSHIQGTLPENTVYQSARPPRKD